MPVQTPIVAPASGLTTLQSLIWPNLDLCRDPTLAIRLRPNSTLHTNPFAIACTEGGSVAFDTAFNLFPLRKWQERCGLKDLSLRLSGSGSFTLTVTAVTLTEPPAKSRAKSQTKPQIHRKDLLTTSISLDGTGAALTDLSAHLSDCHDAVLVFSLTAMGEAWLTGAAWQTRQAPLRQPRLMLGITTFKREKAVLSTVAKFTAFAESWQHGDLLHLVVVDNGQSVTLPATPRVTLVPNRNLGGAGGFARCLYEAERLGATHALFMDDDASVDMLALERVWAMLAYATDTATTVIGGLTKASVPTRVWESGAAFDRICHSFFRDTDLTKLPSVLRMEFHTSAPLPYNYYGGFWFFAFALDHAKRWPFPFFVRGDDINFSLANDFSFLTLPGVVSFQDLDFSDKETALTLYLDLRNHLIQHLTLPKLELGLRKFASIPMFFLVRSLIQNHMDTIATLNLAMEDVLGGPEFFAANADMTDRRATIMALRKHEIWRPMEGERPKQILRINPHSLLARALMKLTLNGLFLPFFGLWGNHLVLRRTQRGDMRLAWGAARITYIDTKTRQSMTVEHNKLEILRLGLRSLRNLARLTLGYRGLKAKWRSGFDGLTSREFWESQFHDGKD